MKAWDNEQADDGDEGHDRKRPVAKDYFGHDLPWKLGTCADTHHTTRTKHVWPKCHNAHEKASKRMARRREVEMTYKEVLSRQLSDKKPLLGVIAKPLQQQKLQQEHPGLDLKNVRREGSIVFIKTHKTATEYECIFTVLTLYG